MDYETNSKYEVSALAIDFVEWKDWKYKYVEVDFSNEDFENFKNELIESWTKIKNIDFWKELLKKEEIK